MDAFEAVGLVGVADQGAGPVGDEVGVAVVRTAARFGDVVGATPGPGSQVMDLEAVATASSPGSGSARRAAAPPARSWVRVARNRLPIDDGAPSSSTSTGSMVALARSCSSNESAIGMPAISAGPDTGIGDCTTGRVANVGRLRP